MTPFEHLLKDDEIAAVFTFARNSFGNKASPISTEQVAQVRAEMKDKKDLYNVEDLLCLLYTSPSPRDGLLSRMPSSA